MGFLGLRSGGSPAYCSLELAWNGHQDISSTEREGQNGGEERRERKRQHSNPT